MWEWLLDEIKKAVKALRLSSNITGVDKGDIMQNVALYLCQHQDMAERIYKNKEVGLIYQLAKHEIYEQNSKMFFENKVELSRYQRIMAACEKYDIAPIPESAYKISAILENGSANFTISGIVTILSQNNPLKNGYFRREENIGMYTEFIKDERHWNGE